ncbi:MAG: hypothetical protein CM15mP117_23400 [Alphaproteobacteria bacterium]|nr:MAG: hypothetical protein CM15mP117_23400 [Alphaproteobacteria bacterium]
MRCTLMTQKIPDDKMPVEMLWNYQDTDKVIKVFDLDLSTMEASPSRECGPDDISCRLVHNGLNIN